MNKKIIAKFFSLAMGFSGIALLSVTFYPIVSYELDSRRDHPMLLSPLSETKTTLTSTNYKEFDFSKASNWFVGGVQTQDYNHPVVGFFTISVPSLKIENATVTVGGEDLSQSLIQYPGTALPGKVGNSVIFGHSILPQFFNPKDYMTIFSTLPTIKKGAEVIANYDGVVYKYRVEDKFEVLPTDLQVLDQNTHDSYLTLVTCVPPGDPRKPKRLIVRAKITEFD